MVVQHEHWVRREEGASTWCFEHLTEQDIRTGINNNRQLSTAVKLISNAIPAANIPQIFGHCHRAIERHLLAQIAQNLLQREATTNTVTIGIFSLDNNNFVCALDRAYHFVKHPL